MIDRIISSIITLRNIDRFSVADIKTAYIVVIKDEDIDPTFVRRLVYQELLKLTQKGWLVKSTTKKKSLTRYSKTHLFDNDYLRNLYFSSDKEPKVNTDASSFPNAVHTRLSGYNTELLEGLGSVQEFIELKKVIPHRNQELTELCAVAHEKNLILLGKINALKKVSPLQLRQTDETKRLAASVHQICN